MQHQLAVFARWLLALVMGACVSGGCSGDDDRNAPAAATQLSIYPVPVGIPASSVYEVTVNGESSFVYMTTGPAVAEFTAGHTSSWTSFDFEGTVDVTVRRLDRAVSAVTVRPRASQVVAQVEDSEIHLRLDGPAKLCIECDGDLQDVLFLFANGVETDTPSPDDPNVVWFEPGVHEIGKFYQLQPGMTYYLAAGAFLKGSFAGGGDGTRVTGRGVLSGAEYPWPGHLQEDSPDRVDLVELAGDGVELSGVTLVDSPYYVIIANGSNNTFRDLKIIAWNYNTDGLSAGPGARIDDCFLRVADDAFKPFVDDTQITGCVLWQDRASSFQLTWNAISDSGGSVVRDCDVIHHMPFITSENEWTGGVFWSWHGGSANIHDILFEDIRIEDTCAKLIEIFSERNPWSPQTGPWGSFSRLCFRNITVENPSRFGNRLAGHDDTYTIDGISFENVSIGGTWVRSPADMDLDVNEFVRNLQFIAPPAGAE